MDQNGWYTIAWEDTKGKGPFEVLYQYWNEETREGQTAWRLAQSLEANTFQYSVLAPGITYRLIVRDSDGNAAYKTVQIPDQGTFEIDQKTKVTLNLKYQTKAGQKDSSAKRDTKLSVAGIAKNTKKGYQYGLEVLVKYTSKGKTTTTHNGVAVICSPDGYYGFQGVTDFKISKKKGDTASIRYLFPDFFRVLSNREEGIPQGEYAFKLYLEGKLFAEASFTLKK